MHDTEINRVKTNERTPPERMLCSDEFGEPSVHLDPRKTNESRD